MDDQNQPTDDEILAGARATAALFKDRDPPECFTMCRSSSVRLARAFLLVDVSTSVAERRGEMKALARFVAGLDAADDEGDLKRLFSGIRAELKKGGE